MRAILLSTHRHIGTYRRLLEVSARTMRTKPPIIAGTAMTDNAMDTYTRVRSSLESPTKSAATAQNRGTTSRTTPTVKRFG